MDKNILREVIVQYECPLGHKEDAVYSDTENKRYWLYRTCSFRVCDCIRFARRNEGALQGLVVNI